MTISPLPIPPTRSDMPFTYFFSFRFNDIAISGIDDWSRTDVALELAFIIFSHADDKFA